MRKRILFVAFWAAVLFTGQAFAQNCGCQTSSINFNTGYNRPGSAKLPYGSYDNDWQLIGAPASASISIPLYPYVIVPYSLWGSATPGPLATLTANAGWLSPFNTSSYTINNPAPDSFFKFQFTFCVCARGQYQFSGFGNADDYADMVLDGTTTLQVFNAWNTVFPISYTASLTPGTHTLWLRLRNLGGALMGVAASGTITQVGGTGGLIGYDCCNNGGGILVRKFADVNCDGKIDAGDSTMQGWHFTLSPGGYSGTTDGLGNYFITNVPAGTYTVNETVLPGWSPVLPSISGSGTVVVSAGLVSEIDFLNSNCVQNPGNGTVVVHKYADLNCDGKIDNGDSLMKGWVFTLNPGGFTATTDATGTASFTVPAGPYTLSEAPIPGGWTPVLPTTTGTTTVTVVSGGTATVNFLNTNCGTQGKGKVLIKKYADVDCDGKIGPNDSLMQGWTFTLSPGGYTGTTNSTGTLGFSVPTGTYTVSESVLPGWHAVLPNPSGTTTIVVTNGVTTEADFLNSHCGGDSCSLQCYWRVTGNSFIDSTVNFLGTTNQQPIIIETNNKQRAIVEGHGDGNIGIATTTPTTIFDLNAMPPSGGAPSGLRLENLPAGAGNILVVDKNGYVYEAKATAQKAAGGPTSGDVTQLQNQVANMQAEIDELKASIATGITTPVATFSVSPNPTSGEAVATYQLLGTYIVAEIRLSDNTGKVILTQVVAGNSGNVTLNIPRGVASSQLICTLLVDGKIAATQKLVLLNK